MSQVAVARDQAAESATVRGVRGVIPLHQGSHKRLRWSQLFSADPVFHDVHTRSPASGLDVQLLDNLWDRSACSIKLASALHPLIVQVLPTRS